MLKRGCSGSDGEPGSGEEGVREAEVFSLIPGSLCGVNVWGQTWAILILRIKPKRWVRAQKSFFPNPPKVAQGLSNGDELQSLLCSLPIPPLE